MGLTGMKTLAPAIEASTPLPLPRTARPAFTRSQTAEEINLYWRMKRMIEEDHLTAANKAVARIRAKALKEEDYRKFEESLEETLYDAKKEGKTEANHGGEMDTWIRFRDWWTKSKFSYLNQPTIKSMGENAAARRPTSTYIPQYTCFSNFSPPAQLCFTSFGVLGEK